MDALAIELTAQIAEQNGGISESICIVQEAVKSGILTIESLAKLNCRRGLTTQIDSDREKVLSDLPVLRVIASQVANLESILTNPSPPSFHTR